ncbi:MAG: hypothetical protein ABSA65_19325 [Acidimicrobiales bacterium]
MLFPGNNAAGAEDMIAALGRERVLIGLPNAGGDRQGYLVHHVWSRWFPLLLSELDGSRTARAEAIVQLLRGAGLRARVQKNLGAYQKTHFAGLAPFAGALYRVGGDVRKLAHTS